MDRIPKIPKEVAALAESVMKAIGALHKFNAILLIEDKEMNGATIAMTEEVSTEAMALIINELQKMIREREDDIHKN